MEQKRNELPNPLIQLSILFGLIGGCLFLCLFLVKLLLPLLFGISNADNFIISIQAQKEHTYAALFMQSLASTWGMFLLPALIFTQVMRFDLRTYFKIERIPQWQNLLLGTAIIILGGIFINLLVNFMQAIPLPDSLSFLRNSQTKTEGLIESFFSRNTWSHFFVLCIVMALLPAVAEELFFRGILQTSLQQTIGPIGGILIASLSFSFMHLEFDNSLAIWFMGVVLGLLYYYTQNLWISIIAHFINNFLMVALKFAFINQLFSKDFSDSTTLPTLIPILSGVCMIGLLYVLKQRNHIKLSNLN